MRYISLILTLVFGLSLYAQPTLTGDADTDFPGCSCFLAVNYDDPTGDINDVCGTVPQTGFDVDHVYMHYDLSADILYVGMSMVGIAGDADGDGDPQTNTLCATVDCAGCGKPIQTQEVIGINFDVDEDGDYEYFAGWPRGSTSFGFYAYYAPTANPTPKVTVMTPSTEVSAVPFADPPSATAPDPEFRLINYSNIDPDGKMTFEIYTETPGGVDEGSQSNIGLPVTLSSFEAQYTGQTVQLDWQTTQETNNAGFEIQIAQADLQFQTLGFVQGMGTTSEPMSYSFAASDFQNGINYFRLKQIDLDGVYAFSPTVAVFVDDARLQIKPTLVSDFLEVDNMGLGVAKYQIISLDAKILQSGDMPEGRSRIAVQNLPSGLYLFKVSGENNTQLLKFLKP
jgi:hypothetical protein